MTPETLRALIAGGETLNVEFKDARLLRTANAKVLGMSGAQEYERAHKALEIAHIYERRA